MIEMHLGDSLMMYCERHGPGLFAEPLNALSNVAFFVAAWMLWPRGARYSGPSSSRDRRMRLVAALIALVGAASLAFHTFATRWANLLDVAFIGVFNLVYLAMFLRVVLGWRRAQALAATVAFVVVDRAFAVWVPGTVLNGSVLYLPALMALTALTVAALRSESRSANQAGRTMAAALAVFLVSLAARTIDRGACAAWPWGTHFVWHVLNAWVLYRLSRALETGVRSAEGDADALSVNRLHSA